MTRLLRTATSRHIVFGALKVSLVVGTLLNVVNQGEQVYAGGNISWCHFFLNYVVPYCVASYSAAKNEMRGSNP